MEIYEALNAYLLTQPGLTALIGDRLSPNSAPQGEIKPYVTYRFIDNVIDHIFSGQQKLEHPKIEYIIVADTMLECSAVARQIRIAFLGRESQITGLTAQCIDLINDIPSEYTNDDGTLRINTQNLEYEIFFNYE